MLESSAASVYELIALAHRVTGAAKWQQNEPVIVLQAHWAVPDNVLGFLPSTWIAFNRIGTSFLPPYYDTVGWHKVAHVLTKPLKAFWWGFTKWAITTTFGYVHFIRPSSSALRSCHKPVCAMVTCSNITRLSLQLDAFAMCLCTITTLAHEQPATPLMQIEGRPGARDSCDPGPVRGRAAHPAVSLRSHPAGQDQGHQG